ncbi:MAG: HipA domain-containing protein [Planctomycetes bacterium]|nr:HipA domain-containing protein [Planctomycetota bacterium]
MTGCPGCFKAGQNTYCVTCRKRLFGGQKIPFVLPFSRPAYDQQKLDFTPDRLSISGIQSKISLALNNGRLEMAKSGGRYILKPRPRGTFLRLEIAPINEHLTMQIARQVFDIEVADNALVAFEGGELAYLVRRFDIQPDGKRSLQEDFAQIAGRSEETHGENYKYDFSYEEIGELIRKNVAAYKVDLERFYKLVVFNYLVHNGDAHVKNFSLIKSEQTGSYNLTPAYDLLNTRLHLPNESPTALGLFKGEFETASYAVNAYYAYDDFVEFAKKLALVESRYKRILDQYIGCRDEVFSLIERSMLPDESKQLYKQHVDDRVRAISYSYSESQASNPAQ